MNIKYGILPNGEAHQGETMKRNPLYVFQDLDATGIYKIPLNSLIQIADAESTPGMQLKVVQLIANTGLTEQSTIRDFLANSALYVEASGGTSTPSELEKILESGNTGWRLLGRDEANYGDIGQDAVDLSNSNLPVDNGAMGDNSFTAGKNTRASGANSTALGEGSVTTGVNSTVLGQYNDNNGVNIFEVGIGTSSTATQNALEINKDGSIIAASLTPNKILDNKSVVTKEYSDLVDAGTPTTPLKNIRILRTTSTSVMSHTYQLGALVWVSDTNEMRIGDGFTAGGIVVAGDLSDLNDVNYPTTLTVNDVLIFDGTDWVNIASTELGRKTFIGLDDTPANFAGAADKLVKVNTAGDALEYTDTIDGGTFTGV